MATLKTLYGNEKPTIPQALILTMTEKELKFMAEWNGPDMHTPVQLEENKTLLKTMEPYIGKMSAASRTALNAALADRKSGVTLRVGNPEQALWKTGSAAYYTKDTMFMVQATGEVTSVPNTIIPDPIGRRRNGLVPMTVFMGSLCKVSKGKMTLLHDVQNYHKRWIMTNSPFRPFRMMEVLDVFMKAIGEMSVWKVVQETEETLTNERLLEFLYTCLHDMPELYYYYLHTFVVFEILTVFEMVHSDSKKEKKGALRFSLIRKKKGGKFSVPETAYTILQKEEVSSKIQRELHEMGYPAVVIFRGGMQPNIKVARDSDMAAAVAAKSLSITTRGSDKSAMSFLCRNAPYSGLAVEEVRILQRCVAMVGGVVESGVERIDIEISSIGHVAVLFSSLMAHFPTVDWMLSMTGEMSMKCATSYASRISTDRRVGSHFLRYTPYQMKSHTLKKKEGSEEMIQVALKNYNADSVKWRPHPEHSGYTIYTTLFGYYPWAVPETTEGKAVSSDRSYIDRVSPMVPHYVYRFGQTESFCGIVSTVDKLSLFGQEVAVSQKQTTAGKRMELIFSKKTVPLERVKTESEWYRRVIESNAAMEAYWMHARPKFSSISNILRVPKQGVTVAYDALGDVVIEEQGQYIEVDVRGDEEAEEMDQSLIEQQSDFDSNDISYETDEDSDEAAEGSDEDDEQEALFSPEKNLLMTAQTGTTTSASTDQKTYEKEEKKHEVKGKAAVIPRKRKKSQSGEPPIVISFNQM